MEPSEQKTGSGGTFLRWMIAGGLVIVIIIILLLTWRMWSPMFLAVEEEPATDEGDAPALQLDGTTLRLDGASPGEVDLEPLVKEISRETVIERERELAQEGDETPDEADESDGPVQEIFNTINQQFTTIVEETTVNEGGETQTLSLSGNVLSISDGNSVDLPTSDDNVVGNEVTDVTANAGLLRVGSGTTLDPYEVGLQACPSGEVLKSTGSGEWECATDGGGTSYTAGNGLQLVGLEFSIDSPTCSGADKLQWTGTAFTCATDEDTTYTAGTGLDLSGTTFSNTGVLTVSGSGAIVSSGGQNPDIAFVDGTTAGQFWQWDGTNWVLTTDSDGDTVVGNEIVDVTGSSSGLTRSGSGTSGDPYTVAANTGDGIQIASNAITIDSPTCSGTDKLQWTGTAFTCDTDQDTTYSAGTGLDLTGTTFSNTGVLSVTGSGAITSSGGQNPDIAFADGTTSGEFWQWNGTSWVLATDDDGDMVVGNEITDVTGTASGLTRSGTGTGSDPYTVAANTGDGIQIASNAITVDSPTCSGTDKLQWTGTAFVCASDQDTTYSAGTGLALVGTTFNIEDTTVASGSYGDESTTAIPTFTVDAQGRLTAAGSFTLTGSGPINVSSGTISCSTCLTDVTLQDAYDSGNTITTTDGRDIAFNLANTTTDADFTVNIQGTGNALRVQDAGTDTFTIADEGVAVFRNSVNHDLNADGESGFAVQNAAGDNMLTVDTTNGFVVVGEVQSGIGATATAQLAIGDTCTGGAQGCIHLGEYNTSDSDRLQIQAATGVMFTTDYTEAERMFLSTAGRLGIGTITPSDTLDVDGTVRVRTYGASTSTTVCRDTNGVLSACSSSEKYKENIADMGYGMDVVEALRPVSFDWKDDGKQDIGFVAEEMAEHVPEVITYRDGEVEGINYHLLTAVLTNAMQEQQMQIDELREGVFNGGLVANDTTFDGLVTFNDDVQFSGDVTFNDTTAGSVTVPAGQQSVEVPFATPHPDVPVVNATPQDFVQGQYRVRDISKEKFVVELSETPSSPVRFNWNAFLTE